MSRNGSWDSTLHYLHQLTDEVAAYDLRKRCSTGRPVAALSQQFAHVQHATLSLDGARNITHTPPHPVNILHGFNLLPPAPAPAPVPSPVLVLPLPPPPPHVAGKCSTREQDAAAGATAGDGCSQRSPQQGRRSDVEVSDGAQEEEG